jgi:hypothetical protein
MTLEGSQTHSPPLDLVQQTQRRQQQQQQQKQQAAALSHAVGTTEIDSLAEDEQYSGVAW